MGHMVKLYPPWAREHKVATPNDSQLRTGGSALSKLASGSWGARARARESYAEIDASHAAACRRARDQRETSERRVWGCSADESPRRQHQRHALAARPFLENLDALAFAATSWRWLPTPRRRTTLTGAHLLFLPSFYFSATFFKK